MITHHFTDWLNALIAPWAFAPHPNFSKTPNTPASVISGLILGARQDPREALAQHEVAGSISDALAAIEKSMVAPTQADGITKLWSIASSKSIPLNARAACALIAAVGESDRDRSASAIAPLSTILNELVAEKNALGSALVSQQLALRFADEGADDASREAFAQSGEHVSAMAWSNNYDAPFSPAFSGSSHDLFESIRYQLQSNVKEGISATERLSGDTWIEVVTRRKGWIAAKLASEISHARDLGVRQMYEVRFEATSNKTRFGGTDPALAGYPALFASELSGSIFAARYARRTVAEQLMLSEVSTDPHFAADALKLLRRAAVSSEVKAAARWLRKRGPVSALSTDGHVIASRPGLRGSLTPNDLFVLDMSADLLSADDAAVAQLGAWDRLDDLLEADALNWSFTDRALSTIATLEQWTGTSSLSVARAARLLTFIAPFGQTIDRSFAKLVGVIDWKEAEASGRDAMSKAVSQLSPTEKAELPQTLSALPVGIRPEITEEPDSLDYIAHLLARGTSELHNAVVALDVLKAALAHTRDEASRGVSSFGGYDEIALAVSYGNAFDSTRLSTEIVDVLLDPSVLKSKKSRGLDLLASNMSALSAVDRHRLVSDWEQLSTSREDWRRIPNAPWPEEIRAGWTIGAISADALFEKMMALEAGSPSDRLQAARTAGHVLRQHSPVPAWLSPSLLHLSTDSDPDVVAEAARALPQALRLKGTEKVAGLRLSSLLHSDSVSVPLYGLVGIEMALNDGIDIDQGVRRQVVEILESHPSRLVRSKAATVRELIDMRD